jgi:hypothetical protein
MWYLHRGGAVEGPYPEDQLRAAFARGELAGTQVCPVGGNAWTTPEAVFGAPAAPSPYAPSPQQGSVPPMQAAAAVYGPPPHTAYGPPAPVAWNQPAPFGAMPGGMPTTGGPPKKNTAKVLGIIAAVLAVLLIGGVALGVLVLLKKPTAHLAKTVPHDAAIYVEIPSLKRSLLSLAGVKVVDPGRVDDKTTAADLAASVADAFDISKTDAQALAFSLDAAAFAARDVKTKGAAAMVFAVGSRKPVETLLKSSRFAPEGSFGKSGKAYKLTAATSKVGATATPLDRTLRGLSTAKGDKLVYFADNELLVFGDEAMVKSIADVVESGADSLEKNPTYVLAKAQFDNGADVVSFADESVIQQSASSGEMQKLVKSYFADGGPMDGAVKFVPAGMLVNAHLTLSGDALPQDKTITDSVKLSYPRTLPGETVAYVAGSTKTGMKGSDAKAQLVQSLTKTAPGQAKQLTDTMTTFEKEAGFTIEQLFDMVGDEAAFALLLDKEFKYGPNSPMTQAALKDAGALFVMQVDDEGVAKQVLAKLRDKAKDPSFAKLASMRPDGDGFYLDPSADAAGSVGGAIPSMHVRYAKKALAIVVAQKGLMDRTFAALDGGSGTLKDDGAHEAAMSALRPKARAYLWVDLGRIVSLAYAANPEDRNDAKMLGVPVDAVMLSGPDRVTAGADFDYHAKDNVWTVDIETLNLWGFSLLAGVDALSAAAHGDATAANTTPTLGSSPLAKPGASPLSSPSTTTTSAGSLSSIGVPACDAYLQRLHSCGQTPAVRQSYQHTAESLHTSWSKLPSASRSHLSTSCVNLEHQLEANGMCDR